MIALRPPEKTEQQLRAIAASGATGLSRKAQAELRGQNQRQASSRTPGATVSSDNNDERNSEIIRRRLAGELPSDIRRAMGISRNVVAGVLDRAGIALGGHADGCRKYNNPVRGEECWNALLGEDDVRTIRAEYVKGSGRWHRGNKAELAARCGVGSRTILVVANGHAWKHVA